MQLRVNELKAVAAVADMTESEKNITRNQCMTLEHFDYRGERKRDSRGRTYQASEPAMLHFSVRINAAEQTQPFYRQLANMQHGVLSFLFNATFTGTGHLMQYDDAMAVEGFIVEIQEEFHSAGSSEATEEQIVLHACMQVRAINYIRSNDNKTLCFVH